MQLPPLHRLAMARTGVGPPSKPERVASGDPGDDPSNTFRLDDDDEKNATAWETLRDVLDDQIMDDWTAEAAERVLRMERYDFDEKWRKDPLFWFALCRRFGWSVDGEARPPKYTGRVAALKTPILWYDGSTRVGADEAAASETLEPRPAEPLVDNARAVRDYYDRHLRVLRQRLQDGADREKLTTQYRDTYRRGRQGLDEETAVALGPAPFNPDSRLRGPMRRPQDIDDAPEHDPVVWGDLQRALYFVSDMWTLEPEPLLWITKNDPVYIRDVRYRGTIDPVTGLAQGYGTLATGSGDPIYEGFWADGDFDGPGKVYATTLLADSTPPGRGPTRVYVKPFVVYEGGFRGGRRHGPGTLFGGMLPDEYWPHKSTLGALYRLASKLKLAKGTFVDGKLEGQGVSYYDAEDSLALATFELPEASPSEQKQRWKELMQESRVMYKGEFKNGRKQGQGTQTSWDGGVYVGEWEEGKRSGTGTDRKSVV